MQALIEIPEDDLNTLDQMGHDRKLSRNQVIQEAISSYISRKKFLDQSFGAWAGRGVDGLEYQNVIRAEWE